MGARLRVHKRERAPLPPGVRVFLEEHLPPDEREKVQGTERMFWKHNGRLAYRAGAMVPLEELDALVSESERRKR